MGGWMGGDGLNVVHQFLLTMERLFRIIKLRYAMTQGNSVTYLLLSFIWLRFEITKTFLFL